jgi:hypothetical protein
MRDKVHFMKLHLKFLKRKLLVYVICLNLLEYYVCTFFKFFLKKSLVDILPQHYGLKRWTINVKSRVIHGISSDEIQVETQNSSTLMRNSLKLQFDDVVELGSHSKKKKYEHLGHWFTKASS